ncbi:MAG TPA: drug/metabolite exporter YedA [Phycisphaerae bacterium]|nr:drug/metabolite exporter YedA [Phycisphaerae bacterium]
MSLSRVSEPSRLALVAAFAAIYLVWGSTYLAIRIAIESLPPFAMAGGRFIIAGAALYAWARWRGAAKPSAAHWKSALILGAFLLLGGNGAVVWSEKTVPSGVVALLVASVPLWMVLINWVRRGGVRPTSSECIGLVMGFAGVSILFNPRPISGESLNFLGAGVVVLGSLSWAIGSIWSQHARMPASPLLFAGMEMLAGGILLSVAGVVTGEWRQMDTWHFSLSSCLALLYLAVFGSIIAFSAYTWLLTVTSAAKVSTYAYVNPVVAVLLGFLVKKEPVGSWTIAAMAIIVTGVVFITRGRRSAAATVTDQTVETAPVAECGLDILPCHSDETETEECGAERAVVSWKVE